MLVYARIDDSGANVTATKPNVKVFIHTESLFPNVQKESGDLECSVVKDGPSTNSPSPGAGRFATTHWSVVLAAGEPESTRHHQALEALCNTYWFPLYVYLRRQGSDAHQAEDYTQAFLAFLLEKQALSKADPKRGRFRSFLLASLKNFLANEREVMELVLYPAAHSRLHVGFGRQRPTSRSRPPACETGSARPRICA